MPRLQPSELNAGEREELEAWARRPKAAQRLALRSRIVLAAARGLPNGEVAADLDVTPQAAGKWRARSLADRLGGLVDGPRPGAPRTIADRQVEGVATEALESEPADATHRSTRDVAKAVGLSQTAIARIRRAFGRQPHRAGTFGLSADPSFVEKVRDVVGLSLSPPDRAIVLSVDEESQIQALDRTRPLLPMTPGQAEAGTHDAVRHGTTSLFAALSAATGAVVGKGDRRHRQQAFVKSLDEGDAALGKEAGVTAHPTLDNYATHKAPRVQRWLARHPEYVVHVTPTSGSWRNPVERFSADLTTERLRRGVSRGVPALEAAIRGYLDKHNLDPKPFKWTASADVIPKKVEEVCKRTSNSGH